MWIALPELAKLAPRVGLPRDKKRLKERLVAAGSVNRPGAPRRGGSTIEWFVPSLPKPLRTAIEPEVPADPVPFDRYLEATATKKARADRRLALMEELAPLVKRLGLGKAAAELAARPGSPSKDTIKDMWRLVKDLPWSEWHAALVTAHEGRAPVEIHEEAWRYFFSFCARPSKPTFAYAYAETVKVAAREGWGRLPSQKTFERRWYKLPIADRTYWQEGERGYRRRIPTAELDKSAMATLERVVVDGRCFDQFVASDLLVVGQDGRPYRPWVAAAIDDATSYCLAYAVANEGEGESGDLYRRLLMGVMEHGVPQAIVFDNTMAAANKKITGGQNIRFRFNRKDDELKGILARLDILAKFTQPGEPQQKITERFWLDVKKRVEKHPLCEGAYAGRSPDNKPSNYGQRAISRDTFLKILAEAVAEYNERKGRRSKVGPCYREAFEAKLREITPRKLTALQKRWVQADAHVVTVRPDGGVRIGQAPNHNTYWHKDLRDYAGQKVVVLVNPDDFTEPVMVMRADDSSLILRDVPLFEKLGANNAADAATFARAQRDLKKADRQSRAAKRRLEAAELAAMMPPAAPPSAPQAAIVQMVPGAAPNVVTGAKSSRRRKAASADPTPLSYDAAKAAQGERRLGREPEPTLQGFNPDRLAEAERILANHCARVVA